MCLKKFTDKIRDARLSVSMSACSDLHADFIFIKRHIKKSYQKFVNGLQS
jgi:hypothetical protein